MNGPMYNNPYYNAPMGAPAQPYMNYGMPYGGIGQPVQPVQPKMTQILSPEDINTLKAKNTTFNINVDPVDILRACCVHRENGNFKIIDNGDGTVTCSICGETFTPIYSADDENIEAIIRQAMDVLNTIKLAYVDLPPEMGKEYFPIIELIKKIPALYKISMNDLNKYTNIQQNQQQNAGAGYGNAFANLNMITSGYGSYYQPQPYNYAPAYDPNQTFMPGQPTPASMAQQNISMTPTMPSYGYNPTMNQAPVPPAQNPFNMYAQPQAQAPAVNPYAPTQAPAPMAPQPYKPQTQPVPAGPTSTPAPTAPPAPEQVTVTETIKV